MPTIPAVDRFDCFAAVTPGLEALALDDARSLGMDVVPAPEGGGLAWQGDAESLLRANIGLRIASRVVVRIAQFEARSFAELEKHARRIAWHRFIADGAAVRFRVTCRKSRLYHSDAVAQRFADAVVRALPGTHAEGASSGEDDVEGDEEAQLFLVRFVRDRCTVSADSSGALLHRRGYRRQTAKAPLRETIAAALLKASGWDGTAPLVDPLCGSGTIPIEAALIARRIPPGVHRAFAMEAWPIADAALGARVRGELLAGARRSAPAVIAGYDRDAGAIVAAGANAGRAGVADDVQLAEQAISELAPPGDARGWIVSNPPYGVRVGDRDRVRDLWARLGQVLRERARGWHVALLSPDLSLERQLGISTHVRATTTNGGIPVRIIVGQVPG